jgi:hypothetical protein
MVDQAARWLTHPYASHRFACFMVVPLLALARSCRSLLAGQWLLLA